MTDPLYTVGDTGKDLTATLNADLTGAAAQVNLRKPDQSVLTKAATLDDAATGRVRSTWTAGDINIAGWWEWEVQVTYASGKVQTFPGDSFLVRTQIA